MKQATLEDQTAQKIAKISVCLKCYIKYTIVLGCKFNKTVRSPGLSSGPNKLLQVAIKKNSLFF